MAGSFDSSFPDHCSVPHIVAGKALIAQRMETHEALMEEAIGLKMKNLRAAVDDARANVSPKVGGTENGKDWLEGFDATTTALATLQQVAEATIS